MAIQNAYKLHAVGVHTTSQTSEVIIPALTTGEITTEANIVKELTAGVFFPTASRLNLNSIGMRFATRNIKLGLDTIGPNASQWGQCILVDGTHPGVHLYFAQYVCDGPLPGSSGLKYTLTGGVLVPTTFSVDHRGDCIIEYRILAVAADGTAPIVMAAAEAMPAIVGDDVRWTMHTATINGNDCQGKRRINVDMAPQINTEGADSEDWDSFAEADNAQPVTTVEGVQPAWLNQPGTPPGLDIPIGGANLAHADTSFFFRKRNNATPNDDHITMTTAGQAYWPTAVTGAARALAGSTLEIHGIQDASANPPLMFDTTSKPLP